MLIGLVAGLVGLALGTFGVLAYRVSERQRQLLDVDAGELSLPPGALAPETVAKAVVRLATRPRNTTVVGAPAIALKLGQFVTPNLGAAIMNGFMDVWSKRADPAGPTSGALFEPPATASGVPNASP